MINESCGDKCYWVGVGYRLEGGDSEVDNGVFDRLVGGSCDNTSHGGL